MASITERKSSYLIRTCVGRDELYKQVWRSQTIPKNDPRLDGLTPKKLQYRLSAIAYEFESEAKERFRQSSSSGSKADPRITLERFIYEKWIPLHVQNGKHTPATVGFYHYMAKDISSYFGKVIRVSEITQELVERYIIYLRKSAKTKQGAPLSETTVKRHYETLRQILNNARTRGYIKQDVFADFKFTSHDKDHTVDFLREAEAAAFLRALAKHGSLYWACLMKIMLFAGLRRGEVAALQWGDLKREKGITLLSVSRNATIDTSAPEKLRVGPTKTRNVRLVPLPENLVIDLEMLKADQESKYGPFTPGAFIFCAGNNVNRPLYPTAPTKWLSRFVQKYGEEYGFHAVSPHDLRHSAATLLKNGGLSIKDISELLGHSDVRTTMSFYTGASIEHTSNAISALEKSLTGDQLDHQAD